MTHPAEGVGRREVVPDGQRHGCGAACHRSSATPPTSMRPLGPRPVGSPPWMEP
jgi:hypothetical protein